MYVYEILMKLRKKLCSFNTPVPKRITENFYNFKLHENTYRGWSLISANRTTINAQKVNQIVDLTFRALDIILIIPCAVKTNLKVLQHALVLTLAPEILDF